MPGGSRYWSEPKGHAGARGGLPGGASFHVVAEQAMTLRGLAAGVAGWFGREPGGDIELLPQTVG
jgi:hypothetical protein